MSLLLFLLVLPLMLLLLDVHFTPRELLPLLVGVVIIELIICVDGVVGEKSSASCFFAFMNGS